MKKYLAMGMAILVFSMGVGGCGSAKGMNLRALIGIGNMFPTFQESGVDLFRRWDIDLAGGDVLQSDQEGQMKEDNSSTTGDAQAGNQAVEGDAAGDSSAEKPTSQGNTGNNHKPESASTGNQSNPGNDSNSEGGDSGSGNTDNPKPPAPVSPSEPAHVHNWVAQTEVVQHEATGHYETKVVQEAWDEEQWEDKAICNKCGADLTDETTRIFHYDDTGCDGGWVVKSVKVGTVHHDAVTEQVWVEDSKAWSETVVTGSVCSGCGAVK